MNDSQCSIFRSLSQSFEYHILSALKGIICVAGALGVSMQWKRHGVRFLVHENTQILFRFYFAVNIMTSVIFASIHFLELFRLLFDCFLLDFRYVLLTRGIGIASFLASQNVILVLSFERLYSALKPAHFEKHSSRLFSVLLALTVIFGAYAYSMSELSDNFRLFHGRRIEVALLNLDMPENRRGFKDLTSTLAISNGVALITLCLDFYLNYLRKPVNSASLAVAYQFAENRRIVLILLPIEITQTSIGLCTGLSLILHRKLVKTPTPIEQQLFLELATAASLCFPIILTFLIKRSAKKKSNQIHPIDSQVDHFEALRRAWDV